MFLIVGNKCDRKSKKRVSEDEISAFIDELGYSDKHFLISAYTGENVEKVRSITFLYYLFIHILWYCNILWYFHEKILQNLYNVKGNTYVLVVVL